MNSKAGFAFVIGVSILLLVFQRNLVGFLLAVGTVFGGISFWLNARMGVDPVKNIASQKWDETITIPLPNGFDDMPDVKKVAVKYFGEVAAMGIRLEPTSFLPEKAIIYLRYKGDKRKIPPFLPGEEGYEGGPP